LDLFGLQGGPVDGREFPAGTANGMSLLRLAPAQLFDGMKDRAGPRALTTEF
jgi:hypothetical protein